MCDMIVLVALLVTLSLISSQTVCCGEENIAEAQVGECSCWTRGVKGEIFSLQEAYTYSTELCCLNSSARNICMQFESTAQIRDLIDSPRLPLQ